MATVTFNDVRDAAHRIRGHVRRTPLLESPLLNGAMGCRVMVKAESLQLGGSFKVRGATNRLLRLPTGSTGVVAFSSGNFAQGLAVACKRLGVKCTVVMPEDAPPSKQHRVRGYGAEVVLSKVTQNENREVTAARVAERLAKQHRYTLLHPFEDPDVIAGQGTAGLEIVEDLSSQKVAPSRVFIPAGGGGLAAGCSTAIKEVYPSAEITIVEPEGYDDHCRSFTSGQREKVVGSKRSLCDALQAAAPGKNTWPINRLLVTGGMTVTDDEVRAAMRLAADYLQLVLEPGGAAALAAAYKVRETLPTNGCVVVVASGGNIDALKFAELLQGDRAKM